MSQTIILLSIEGVCWKKGTNGDLALEFKFRQICMAYQLIIILKMQLCINFIL